MTRPRLYMSRNTAMDCLSAIEFGFVVDGQPDEAWQVIGEQVGFLFDGPEERCIGFHVNDFSTFDPEAEGFESIWHDQPHFDVPQLGLRDASAGEVCMAASSYLGDEPTLNQCYFSDAIVAGAKEDHEQAVGLWRLCLESGDPMAHYGLGYTLYELGDLRGAYRHLRAYAEITPNNSWAWCWLGRTCLALGDLHEARTALETAVELGRQGADETDASELMEELEEQSARQV